MIVSIRVPYLIRNTLTISGKANDIISSHDG